MYTNGGDMKDFENQLDEIRIQLYEETKELCKEDIIKNVNYHAQKIAHDFGFTIKNTIKEEYFQTT